MKNYEYHVPTKIIFGKDTHFNVGKIIDGYGFKNVLVHFGGSYALKSGLIDIVKESLEKFNIKYHLLGGVTPNPVLDLVHEGVKLCKKEKIDFILAVGGGSVIDSSKLIASGALVDFDPWLFSLKEKTPECALPVGTILTISAAGSEMSQSCVISNPNGNYKRGFNSKFNQCLFSICNPELTYSVSKYQTACGIVDILMHTLERYYTTEDGLELTDNMSIGLFKSVIEAGKVAMDNPNDYNARATLMWASSLSHNGLTGVGRDVYMPVHQLEHELSGMYPEVAHGAGLAAIYSSWCRYVYQNRSDKFAKFAYEVMGVEKTEDIFNDALEGINRLELFFKEINMPTSLRELNVKECDLETLAHNFTFGGTRVLHDIKDIGFKEALDIYKMAY